MRESSFPSGENRRVLFHLYRYRSVKQLLGEFQELEKQEIYFCPPRDLNDPMEGFMDLYWSGDEIVWRNLLKHYILCLLHIAPTCFATPACFAEEREDARELLRSAVFMVPGDLPPTELRLVYGRASEAFLNEPAVRLAQRHARPVAALLRC